eukprot:tig00000042_g15534.t1
MPPPPDHVVFPISKRRMYAGAALCGLACTAIVWYVHVSQKADRERMHQGVIRDMQREAWRRQELEKRRLQEQQLAQQQQQQGSS